MAEVYGSGYQDDVNYSRFNLRATQTHKEAMILQLKKLDEAYELVLRALDI